MEQASGSRADILLEARDLVLAYGHHKVVEVEHLAIRRGQFWFFLGPNGHGKSTLLHALMGILSPAAGTLYRRSGETDRRCIGYVPQTLDARATLPLTVREFALLGMAGLGRGVYRREGRQRLAQALERVGLAERERHSFWSLSGGQRQRAVLARALVRRPRLLLVDEPTNNLDVATEEGLLRLVERMNREEGVTVVFVTHAAALAPRFASHVALVHGGGVEAGRAPDLLRPERLSRALGIALPESCAPESRP